MTLSVLIVNWRSKEYLRPCIESIESTCADLCPQIVVVDGGSFDGCGEMLAAEFPRVTFIQSPENIGFGRSNNLGFEQVAGEAVLFLNPDTELKEGAASALVRELERLPAAGAVGPRLLNTDGSLQTNCVQSLPTPLNQALDSDLLRRLFPKFSIWGTAGVFSCHTSVEVEAICGACILIRSEVFRKVSGFSAEYFMYGEDMDLCAKVRRCGLKIFHVPSAKVLHHGGRSSAGSFGKLSSIVMRDSVFRFIRKDQGNLAAFIYRVLMAISALVRIVLLALGCVFSGAGKARARRRSLWKWIGILRWSIGIGVGSRDPLHRHRRGLSAICAASPAK
jgi:hypothetical protein